MHPNALTWIFGGLFVVAYFARRLEKRSTELYATVAESLGLFLFSPADATTTLGCAPSPEPRALHSYAPGKRPVTFEFGDKPFSVVIGFSKSLLSKRNRVDLVITPGADEKALHVMISADGRPPVFEGEVRFDEATKGAPFYLGQP